MGVVAGGGRIDKPLLKAGSAYHKYKNKRNCWPKVRGVAMNVSVPCIVWCCSYITGGRRGHVVRYSMCTSTIFIHKINFVQNFIQVYIFKMFLLHPWSVTEMLYMAEHSYIY